MRRFLRLAAPTFAFAALVVPGGAASVTGPQCGDVVTGDMTLTQDLVCSGDGLVVPGWANVHLNLGGHSISGSGGGTGVAIGPTFVEDPSMLEPGSVTVEGGAIRGFGTGVQISGDDGVSTLLLDRLAVRDNDYGVSFAVNPGPATVLSNSVITRNEFDGVILGFGQFRMVNDQVTWNGGNGINAFRNSLDALQDSVIAHNGAAGAALDDTVAHITGNTFLRNGGIGLSISEETCSFFIPYVISNNVADGNGAGGMRMRANCPVDPPPSPGGSGNSAKNNGSFQCIVIVCARNPGSAK